MTRLKSIAVLGVLAAGLTMAPRALPQSSAPSEYQLKAVFLFNFAKFVDWPDASFSTPEAPFTVCVLGKDPFGHFLDDAFDNKKIGTRMLEVERLKEKSEARHCQMLFVSALEADKLPAIIEAVQGTNVLLVGETPDFASSGGTIQFTFEDGRVRFLINTDAAERAGLRLDSKLLALATVVREGHAKGG